MIFAKLSPLRQHSAKALKRDKKPPTLKHSSLVLPYVLSVTLHSGPSLHGISHTQRIFQIKSVVPEISNFNQQTNKPYISKHKNINKNVSHNSEIFID